MLFFFWRLKILFNVNGKANNMSSGILFWLPTEAQYHS
jgi:hypothetical protein